MLFQCDHRRDPRTSRQYALYEIAYTFVDFTAALLFIVGSVFFFYDDLQRTGTWLFLVGSICFALEPTLRLVREVHLAAIGDFDGVAGNGHR